MFSATNRKNVRKSLCQSFCNYHFCPLAKRHHHHIAQNALNPSRVAYKCKYVFNLSRKVYSCRYKSNNNNKKIHSIQLHLLKGKKKKKKEKTREKVKGKSGETIKTTTTATAQKEKQFLAWRFNCRCTIALFSLPLFYSAVVIPLITPNLIDASYFFSFFSFFFFFALFLLSIYYFAHGLVFSEHTQPRTPTNTHTLCRSNRDEPNLLVYRLIVSFSAYFFCCYI